MEFFKGKFFNTAGPCNPSKHYMLPPLERLPDVKGMIARGQCFVVHAPRQCGKTTAFGALAREINNGTDAVALYCSLEVVQGFPKPEDGMPMIYRSIRDAAQIVRPLADCPEIAEGRQVPESVEIVSSGIEKLLSALSHYAGKPLVVFFDEVDCLSGPTLVTFLRQLRRGYVVSSQEEASSFPTAIALIGMRNIRDYHAQVRPEAESLGSASPFNVIVRTTSLRNFTEEEMRELYAQHTAATGQIFEENALKLAWHYSLGQPYLVNALAFWCVDKIHNWDYSKPITAEEIHAAEEAIIRERGTHLDSLMERLKEPRVRAIIQPLMLGEDIHSDEVPDELSYVMDLGLLRNDNGVLKPANPMYAEVMGRYITWGTQQNVHQHVQEIPWVKEDGLDMAGLLTAFQQFWRENADGNAVPAEYREAYPQLVLQAFLQRVINGGGDIIREMALGKRAMDLEVRFRGSVYALECKKKAFYDKSHENAYRQLADYLDRLGLSEGWLVVFDADLSLPWEEKIYSRDISYNGKAIHLLGC